MLQYPVGPPTLSSSSSNDYFRPHDRLSSKRFPKEGLISHPVFPPQPHPISTNLPALSSPSSPSANSPSAVSIKHPRSPYISSRQPSALATREPLITYARSPSEASTTIEDVLAPGDFVGVGGQLQGEILKLVANGSQSLLPDHLEPAKEFQVVRRLGAGSYAVVYLVLEVLSRPNPSDDGHTVGHMELDDIHRRPGIVYGREYAIKCLSKANLDEEALAAQMTEATIHQSLRSHPNIVTLHRTLETSSFLLLLLEYVPGEDLFYFLEQARDHDETDSPGSSESFSSRTPPTPGLLSNMHPHQLLSRTRLRLISSMFSQMCDAVAACHDQQVFHRDIKPENFIVTDGWTQSFTNGRPERKVVVKLTDFGLSTTDVESSDMDCGSAPYMSYECRNNVAPAYRPRGADVWSLGIVLINMLYHFNPWTDTAQDSCNSFNLFRQQPINFFMQRFSGMTRPVAEMLATRVFNILDDPNDDSSRISAHDFGNWAKDLPDLLADHSSPIFGHKRGVSISSIHGHPISSSNPVSHRPTSRQASQAATTGRTRAHSRTTSVFEKPELSELSTVIDQEVEEEPAEEAIEEEGQEIIVDEGMNSRSTSNKRRKRGARKGKGTAATPTTPRDDTLETLASASESLAREISKASKASSRRSPSRRSVASSTDSSKKRGPHEPVSMYAVPTALFSSNAVGSHNAIPPVPPLPPTPMSAPPAPLQVVTKKPSKWRLGFGKGNASSAASITSNTSPTEESPSPLDLPVTAVPIVTQTSKAAMSATVSNVSTLIMGLNPPSTAPPAPSSSFNVPPPSGTWGRGRRNRGSPSPSTTTQNRERRAPSAGTALTSSPNPSVVDGWATGGTSQRSDRASSPNSTRSGRPLASSASSMASGSWRNSTSTSSSAGTSTSAFTHYSNSSIRSISTNATSLSSGSWRTGPKGTTPPQLSPNSPTGTFRPANVPRNIKILEGVPWELDQLPRAQHPSPVGDIFGQPPPRKQRTRKLKDAQLEPITERPPASRKPSDHPRQDASTSTTDLNSATNGGDTRRLPKGQIQTLAKMLLGIGRS